SLRPRDEGAVVEANENQADAAGQAQQGACLPGGGIMDEEVRRESGRAAEDMPLVIDGEREDAALVGRDDALQRAALAAVEQARRRIGSQRHRSQDQAEEDR